MTLIDKSCIEYEDARKICIAEENGKKYTLNNESGYTVQKIKVDKCFKQNPGEKRCDFLFKTSKYEPRCAIFVELKGKDLVTAVKQVLDTITYLKQEIRSQEILVRIVGSRDVPKLKLNPAYQKLIRIIPKDNFKYATNGIYTEKI